MKLNEGIRITGHVECWATMQDGRRVKVVDKKNLVVNVGLNTLRNLISGTVSSYVTHAGIGSGTTPPTATSTALTSEIIRKAVTVDTGVGTGAVEFSWSTLSTEANSPGTIGEAALFDASVSGNMICMATFTPFDKDNTLELDWTWTWTFSSS